MQRRILSIEGNIGSGKSSLIKLIQEHFKDKITVIQEPVVNWQAINNNPKLNLLDAFYKDPKRWGYTFQMNAFYSRIKQFQELSQQFKENSDKVIITERSVYSDKLIFATNSHKLGFLNEIEWALYNDQFDFLVNNLNIHNSINGFIYLQTSPEKAFERIQKRSREEEKTQIEIDYIKSVHSRHEDWLNNPGNEYISKNQEVCIIDGEQEFLEDADRKQSIMSSIEKLIS